MTSSATVDHSRDPAVDHSQAVSHEPEHSQTAAAENSTGSPDIKSQKENASPVGGNAGSEPTAESTTGEVDEFGLPIRIRARPVRSSESSDNEEFHDVEEAASGPAEKQPTSRDSKPVMNEIKLG